MMPKGDTDYAKLIQEEIVERNVGNDVHAYAIQRIHVKEYNREEVRFAYIKNGRFQRLPLDLPEEDFLELFKRSIDAGLFSNGFLNELAEHMSKKTQK